MNLVCDESVESHVVERLRGDGHAVVYVAELSPGMTDDEVLAEANARLAQLITADKDFGELVFRQGRDNSGVVLIRLAGLPPHSKARSVTEVITAHSAELTGAFTVISPGLVRIRRSP